MAGSLAVALVLGLAGLSFAMRAIGPFAPNLPAAITERTSGLAPALLAALNDEDEEVALQAWWALYSVDKAVAPEYRWDYLCARRKEIFP